MFANRLASVLNFWNLAQAPQAAVARVLAFLALPPLTCAVDSGVRNGGEGGLKRAQEEELAPATRVQLDAYVFLGATRGWCRCTASLLSL